MNTKLINPKWHAMIDYCLAGSLPALPSLLRLNKKAIKIHAIEGLVLLPYVAFTKQPVAVKGMIPLRLHKKIDPYNIAQFALQTVTKPFRSDKKTLWFNVAFTAIAAATVLLTDWNNGENELPD